MDMIREPAKPVPPWVLLTSRTFTQDRFENIVPAEYWGNKKDILSYCQCHLNRHALPRHPPRCSVSGMRTDTASMGTRGHRTHADLPRLYTHLCGGALDAGHRCVRCMPRSHVTAAA